MLTLLTATALFILAFVASHAYPVDTHRYRV
jgi:hypothetical protein